MPSHDAQRASAERAGDPNRPADSPGRGLSRRSVLQGAATAGAAGLAVTALGAAVSPASAATRSSSPRGGAAKAASGPLVVHVRDAKSGDIEVFHGTSKTRVRDQDLAARIARAIG
jgi:hypothetical protein